MNIFWVWTFFEHALNMFFCSFFCSFFTKKVFVSEKSKRGANSKECVDKKLNKLSCLGLKACRRQTNVDSRARLRMFAHVCLCACLFLHVHACSCMFVNVRTRLALSWIVCIIADCLKITQLARPSWRHFHPSPEPPRWERQATAMSPNGCMASAFNTQQWHQKSTKRRHFKFQAESGAWRKSWARGPDAWKSNTPRIRA